MFAVSLLKEETTTSFYHLVGYVMIKLTQQITVQGIWPCVSIIITLLYETEYWE